MTQARYLIDVNLPRLISEWNPPEFIHVSELNRHWDDLNIHEYALENDLVILTKGKDFRALLMTQKINPKLVWFRTGNQKFPEFKKLLSKYWIKIVNMIPDFDIIVVYEMGLAGIHQKP